MQLPADFERAIDQRLRAGDPLASADLAEACFQPLVRWLRRAFPGVDDPAFYDDAATESILNYAERPAIFDPARNSLSGFLRMSAAADLRNCLSRQRRVRNHEVHGVRNRFGASSGTRRKSCSSARLMVPAW
ncbi:MAG TPA: hypothetical protein VII23_14835 [Terriglobales bacterium]